MRLCAVGTRFTRESLSCLAVLAWESNSIPASALSTLTRRTVSLPFGTSSGSRDSLKASWKASVDLEPQGGLAKYFQATHYRCFRSAVAMRVNRVKPRIKTGQPTIGSMLNSSSQLVAEIMAHMGFDWLIVDLEHSENTLANLQGILQAISTTATTPLVRLPSQDVVFIKRSLDL